MDKKSNINDIVNKTKQSLTSKENDILQSDYLDSKIKDESEFNVNINPFLTRLGKENKSELDDNAKNQFKNISNNIEKLITDSMEQSSTFERFIQHRLFRHKEYDAMVAKIDYMKRAILAVSSEIISPDDVNDQFYKITEPKFRPGRVDYQEAKRKYEELIERLGLDDELNQLIKWSVKYGESYVEFIDIKNELKNIEILESDTSQMNNDNYEVFDDDVVLDVDSFCEYSKAVDKVKSVLQENSDYNESDGPGLENIKNIKIKVHHPSTIIPITVDDTVLGFIKVHSSLLDDTGLSSKIISALSNKDDITDDTTDGKYIDRYGILDKIASVISDNNLKISGKSAEEILNIDKLIKYINIHNGTAYKEKTLIRFIPVFRMEQLRIIPGSMYDRITGASLFEESTFKAKLLIMYNTAITMARINNSIESKNIKIEVGLEDDVANKIEEVKKVLLRQKYSVDSFPNIDSVPTILTSMNHYITPMKNGQEYISIEKMDNTINYSDKVEDYKAIRDELVAGLGIPPAFLGLEENIESRATLSQQNLHFGKIIVNYQNEFGKCLNNFISKIFVYINQDNLVDEAEFKFHKPSWLRLGVLDEYLNKISTLKSAMESVNYTTGAIKNKIKEFLPEFAESKDAVDEIIDSLIDNKPKEENEYGTGGGFDTGGFGSGTSDFGGGSDIGGGDITGGGELTF